MNFRVELDCFRGPLELLVYLVRKQEVQVAVVLVNHIAEQYLVRLSELESPDVDEAGEFLELTSTLLELKSRLVLPHGDEVQEDLADPRAGLLEQLLEYKKFKDAASMLEERSRSWQQRYSRLASDLPEREAELQENPINELELWDLVSALGRIMRENELVKPASIVYDELPITAHMERIHGELVVQTRVPFSQFFAPGQHKGSLIGVFLAILELVRHHNVHTEQSEAHGEIWLSRGDKFTEWTGPVPAAESFQ